MRRISIGTNYTEPFLSSEEKLAFAVFGRAITDIEVLDRAMKRRECKKGEVFSNGWDAVSFFFARKNATRNFWLTAVGVNLRAIRWMLLDNYPWITDKFSRTGGAINETGIKKQTKR